MAGLPIDPVLPALVGALAAEGRAVLQAPPGAGKTTRVPLALLEAGSPGRILMLEPRRVAARAAAERLAESLGEPVGRRVGYRIRGESVAGSAIEVVTEGMLTRMLQSDRGACPASAASSSTSSTSAPSRPTSAWRSRSRCGARCVPTSASSSCRRRSTPGRSPR